MSILKIFLQDESGATAIEYGLIAALIGLALVTGATSMGQSVNNSYLSFSNKVTTAPAP